MTEPVLLALLFVVVVVILGTNNVTAHVYVDWMLTTCGAISLVMNDIIM